MSFDETRAQRKRRTLLFARQLRQRMTLAEALLWKALRKRQLNSWKFRRQAPIGRFIVDFLCVERNLIVEVDGSIHALQRQYDREREDEFRKCGYKIVRFTNNEVLNQLDATLERIRFAAALSPGKKVGGGRGPG